jgi:uncharacterized protein (TIGR03435 family)
MRQLVLGICLISAIGVAAQEAATFDVATVKANKSGDTNGMLRRLPGGRLTATNMPLRPMITFAYQLAGYQLVGGPSWIDSARYDVVAKMDGNPLPAAPGAGADPMQIALRNLLADRFKLKVHRETRELDIYALVMLRPGTPGPSLTPTKQDCAAAAAAMQRGGIQGGPGRLKFGGLPTASFAQAFSGPSGRMVVDRTGLTGSWDFELNYAPDQRSQAQAGNAAADPDLPSFFTAIQEQLGLKLESTKGPVDVVVIDSIDMAADD